MAFSHDLSVGPSPEESSNSNQIGNSNNLNRNLKSVESSHPPTHSYSNSLCNTYDESIQGAELMPPNTIIKSDSLYKSDDEIKSETVLNKIPRSPEHENNKKSSDKPVIHLSDHGMEQERGASELEKQACVLEPTEEIRVYLTRFWILGLFSFVAFFQCIIWGTWGPILYSAQVAFPSWNDGTIALFTSWGPISVVLFIIPLSWLNQKYGLRFGLLAITSSIFVATLLRCLTKHEQAFTILANVGAIINGLAGCLTLSLPAMVAATWFPPHERTTATAVGALMSQLGGAAMYLEPLVVRTPKEGVSQQDILSDIMNLMYIDTGIAGGLLLCTILYFPNKPVTPPSRSSAVERLDYFKSIKIMVKNKQLMFVFVTYVFSFGIPVVWIGIMNFSLKCSVMDIQQNESMWIAIVSVSVSGVAALIVARITDYIYGHLRITIIALLIIASGFFLWFLLLTFDIITPTIVQVYISVTGGVSFEFASVPLIIELAVELAYPCPESAVGAALTQLFNVISGIFLLLLLIPTECYHWVNIVLVICTSMTVIPLLFVKETHHRSNKDR